MVTKTFEGCSYTEFWVSPSNWQKATKKDLEKEKSNNDIFIIPMGTEIESLKLANQFRKNGYNVDIEMNKRKLKKSLDYANREKIKYVIVIGTDEISSGQLKIKNMDDGNEMLINIDALETIKL